MIIWIFKSDVVNPHIRLTFYKENCMDILTTFGVRGKIQPKMGPQRIGFFGGLLKKWLLLSGDSESLALLGYCYTIEWHHLILHCQNWWTLPLMVVVQFFVWHPNFLVLPNILSETRLLTISIQCPFNTNSLFHFHVM